jgi:hypothetical protein
MAWLGEPEFERRPLVFVEDHLYHTTELLAALHELRPDLLAETTVVALDRRGPDTTAAVSDWLGRYGTLQVVAAVDAGDRRLTIAASDVADASAFARLVARLPRPGGILIQDVQLGTLPFVPADRWWESIYTAATVRGMFPSAPPTIRFLSNKRGYTATFGRDLAEAGFDPRDVMDKSELRSAVVPAVAKLFDRSFPRRLDAVVPPAAARRWPVADSDAARREVEAALDLVLWRVSDGWELGGRAVAAADGRVSFRAGAPEAETWSHLIADALAARAGLPIVGVGERIGPPDAGRAELTNVAARHIHTLRSRLSNGALIETVNHTYRIAVRARIGVSVNE